MSFAPASAPRRTETAVAHVLVVDDSEIVLAATAETLEAAGFRVTTSSNPITIAGLLRQDPPDLMLLDVDMPAVKGPEVVTTLRRTDCLRETRVALFSAHAAGPTALDALAAACGAVGSIPKSVHGDALVDRVQGFLAAPAAPTDGAAAFAGRRAVVIAAGSCELSLVRALTQLGFRADARGPLGVDRVLREGHVDLLVLDAEPFGGNVGAILERLQRRELLTATATLVVGPPTPEADAHLPASAAQGPALARAVTAAVTAATATRAAPTR